MITIRIEIVGDGGDAQHAIFQTSGGDPEFPQVGTGADAIERARAWLDSRNPGALAVPESGEERAEAEAAPPLGGDNAPDAGGAEGGA